MINLGNPMNLFDKAAPPDQVAALRQLFMLLGGLGGQQIGPQPQPQETKMPSILGGLNNG